MADNKDDDFFPGFIENDKGSGSGAGGAKGAPKKPAGPVPEAQPAFNPFAEPVEVPSLIPDAAEPPPRSSGPAVAPASPTDPAPRTANAATGFDAFANSGDEEEADDGELKPGSRKDLWICPHCGTGNRPNRDTCRSCGKSPDDPVIQAWFKQPKVLVPALGGVVILVLLLVMFSGPSFSLSSATLASIDNDLRRDTSLSGSVDLGEGDFQLRGRFAAAGRVVTASGNPGEQVTLTIVFGERARDPGLRALDRGTDEVGFQNNLGSITRLPYARLTLIDDGRLISELPRAGQVVSLIGSWGDFVGESVSNPDIRTFVVRLSGYRAAAAN